MELSKLSLVKVKGFTLIELMIAIVVLAILIAIAAPSFTKQIQRNQMRSAMADFITAVAYARSQAVTRAASVHVRSKNTTSWDSGWCATTDSSKCDSADASFLREFESGGSITVTGDGTTQLFSFNREGHLENAGDVTHISLCAGEGEGKKITVLALGQALAQDCDCTSSNVCDTSS